MSMHKSAWFLVLASCWASKDVAKPVAPDKTGVTVEIASVTLADDCGGDDVAAAGDVSAKSVARRTADSGSSMGESACSQTAVQLAVTATGSGSTKIRIKQVELLDANHKSLGMLQVRKPTLWKTDGYTPWDQTIEGGSTLQASYHLSAPDWSKIPNGRWGAQTTTFHLRVTLVVGETERTVEKETVVQGGEPEGVVT